MIFAFCAAQFRDIGTLCAQPLQHFYFAGEEAKACL
jgi:hypothetical protein